MLNLSQLMNNAMFCTQPRSNSYEPIGICGHYNKATAENIDVKSQTECDQFSNNMSVA